MRFILSRRSNANLVGVNPVLVAVVHRAIQLTSVDFAVTEGVRTLKRQQELVAAGASKTLNSKHITGEAVDLVAFIGDRVSWELDLYFKLADAMRIAATEVGVTNLMWGGAWTTLDITKFNGSMESAHLQYVDTRRRAGKRPFVDAPHFQIG